MAIELISTSKISDKIYVATIRDTADQIGVDENSQPVYRTYSAQHNVNLTGDDLKARFESMIADKKKREDAEQAVEVEIKTAVESIDTTKIKAKE